MDNQWMYVDFNSYFASVEQQLDPKLRGKPVAVMPMASDATCAIAASYEAKAFGVKTGTPIWEAKKMCPGILCVPANHEAYVTFHEKIVEEIDRHVPVAKVCSIDEVACQLMDNERARAVALAGEIKKGLRERVGECITCSIGFAPNCYLAKVATDMKKPNGLVFIREEELPGKLYGLSLRDLPGIGANMEVRLKRHSVLDMQMLCALDMRQMRKIWGGVEGERMWLRLKGIDLPDVETTRQSVGHSHVMAPELRMPEKARTVGRRLVAKAAARLRRIGYVASRISVSMRVEEGERFEASMDCDRVCDSLTFLSLFNQMWEYIIKEAGLVKIKKIGVTLSGLEEEGCDQYEFFSNAKKEKEERISRVLDRINQKYGQDSVSLGALPTLGKAVGTKIAFTRIPEKEEFLE